MMPEKGWFLPFPLAPPERFDRAFLFCTHSTQSSLEWIELAEMLAEDDAPIRAIRFVTFMLSLNGTLLWDWIEHTNRREMYFTQESLIFHA